MTLNPNRWCAVPSGLTVFCMRNIPTRSTISKNGEAEREGEFKKITSPFFIPYTLSLNLSHKLPGPLSPQADLPPFREWRE